MRASRQPPTSRLSFTEQRSRLPLVSAQLRNTKFGPGRVPHFRIYPISSHGFDHDSPNHQLGVTAALGVVSGPGVSLLDHSPLSTQLLPAHRDIPLAPAASQKIST